MMDEFAILGANIKAIGVGGGGTNMINHMIQTGVTGIEMIAANTDAQALASSQAPIKIQLGPETTKGLGAGMRPEVGRNAAEESYEEIKEALRGANLVFIAAGLGGGTGTGAASVVAAAAKEVGALTVSVVTRPFMFEGPKRKKFADQGLTELRQMSDSIVIIPNDKLLAIVNKNTGFKDSFKIVDDVLARAVMGISGVILSHGPSDINIDFADLRTVMSHRGLALMGIGEASGTEAAYEAIKSAIESPLFDNVSINGAMGVLVHFQIHPSYPLAAINNAMSIVYETAHEDADIIFGTTTDETLPPDQVRITIVATGFEREAANNPVGRTEAPSSATRITKPRVIKIASGYDIAMDEETLAVPTYIRRQLD